MAKPSREKIGLILSGGGARAAYQVGVLRAIATLLPKNAHNPFHIISGTSAGALNAAALAANAHRLRTSVRAMEYVWKNITSDQVYVPNSGGVIANASALMLSILGSRTAPAPVAVLNNAPLAQLISRVIKLKRIQKHIDAGLVDALSITASAYSSGESVSFFQGIKGIKNWRGPHRIGVRTQLTPKHLLASAAIPIVFPAVKIGKQYFGDGAIRQLAPTSTALHMGARKMFVIGVSGNRTVQPREEELTSHPSLSQIIGHILNSAFVDTLENDLEFLRHMNEVLELVPERTLKKNAMPHNVVQLLEISPSQELNVLANRCYDQVPRHMKRFIKQSSSGTLLSLLLFESGYCTELWKLGYMDAMEYETKILEFFNYE